MMSMNGFGVDITDPRVTRLIAKKSKQDPNYDPHKDPYVLWMTKDPLQDRHGMPMSREEWIKEDNEWREVIERAMMEEDLRIKAGMPPSALQLMVRSAFSRRPIPPGVGVLGDSTSGRKELRSAMLATNPFDVDAELKKQGSDAISSFIKMFKTSKLKKAIGVLKQSIQFAVRGHSDEAMWDVARATAMAGAAYKENPRLAAKIVLVGMTIMTRIYENANTPMKPKTGGPPGLGNNSWLLSRTPR